jgi:hypothetical protein
MPAQQVTFGLGAQGRRSEELANGRIPLRMEEVRGITRRGVEMGYIVRRDRYAILEEEVNRA